jgi:toxin YoeB
VRVTFATDAWEQYLYWQTADRKILKRVNLLIRDIIRDDSDGGIGKPERLRGDLSGFSSRRIDDEHRLVYRVDTGADSLLIAQCRYHYSDR